MGRLPSNKDFFINSSLYTKFSIEGHTPAAVFDLLYTEDFVECYCLDCQEHSIFKAVDNVPRGQYKLPDTEYLDKKLGLMELVVTKTFACSRDESHVLRFTILLTRKDIVKIGQYPSLADIAAYDIRKYKRILNDYHNEFSKAIGLFAHGIGVGSFVYLRRIIENFIIKPAYETAKKNENWDDNKYQRSKVKDKIGLLKAYLPNFLVTNSAIYSIVSKEIHELSEDECKEYFPVLRSCLEFVLTELEAIKELDLKKAELSKALKDIHTKLQ